MEREVKEEKDVCAIEQKGKKRDSKEDRIDIQ